MYRNESPVPIGLFYASPLSVSTLPWAHRHRPGGQGADEYTQPTEVSTMHASIQQRVDGVAALHVRSRIATAEFYALIGK